MVSVEQIFDLQERCLQHALPVVMEQFTFVKECLELVINRHVHEEVINELDDEDRERIRGVHTYLNEAISHLIISLKLALYGAHVEALTILRNALERMANAWLLWLRIKTSNSPSTIRLLSKIGVST